MKWTKSASNVGLCSWCTIVTPPQPASKLSGTLNRGFSLSARRYLRTLFFDRPVRRDISRIEKWRRMTLNNSILLAPFSPALVGRKRLQHRPNLGRKT